MRITSKMPISCPFCEEGTLHASTRVELHPYGGRNLTIDGFRFSVCDVCGEEMVRAEEARANARLIADACLASDGKMSTCGIQSFRLRHGLTQTRASELFGGGANAFSKYERGEVMPSKAMDVLMRLYDALPEVRAHLGEPDQARYSSDSWTQAETTVVRFGRTKQRPSSLVVANEPEWHDEAVEPMYVAR